MKRPNARIVLAEHFGAADSDIEWYQPTSYLRVKVFAAGDNMYYCATPPNQNPPSGFVWTEVTTDFTRGRAPGWRVWLSEES